MKELRRKIIGIILSTVTVVAAASLPCFSENLTVYAGQISEYYDPLVTSNSDAISENWSKYSCDYFYNQMNDNEKQENTQSYTKSLL